MATTQSISKAVITSVGSAINGGTANSTKPVIAGTADAGTTVNIYDGVRLLGTATVAANGTWSFTPTADLKGGNHQFTAIEVDASGSFGASSTPLSVTVPSSTPVAPAKPIISGMTDDQGHPLGNPTNDPHPNMSGTGTPGDTITMYDGPTAIGSTTVKPDGTWTVEPTKDLSDGAHDIYVIETNPAGTPSTPSDHTAVVVDTSVPATPAAPVMTDDSGHAIPAGSTTTDAHPNISGTGTAGDIIKVYDGSTVIGSVKIGADGKWTFKPTTDLSSGTHDLYVTETNAAGTPSAASPHTSVTINTNPVSGAPVITDVQDAVGPIQGTVPNNGTTDDNHPTISGTGIAGDTIYIYQNGAGCGNTTVDATGHWSLKITGALSEGAHAMTATQFASGQAQSAASNTWTITVDTTTPAKPVISGMTNDSGAAIPAGSTTSDAHPNINGTGKAGDLIKLYDGATLIGSATVGADGKWTIKPATDLSNGTHDLSATETNLAGVPGASSDHISVTINTSTPATPAAPVMTDDSGAVIPAGSTTSDAHPNISGTGTAGDIIKLYDGSTVIGSVTIGADGKWTIKPTTDLSSGTHDLYVTETNPAGTPSAASPHVALVVASATPTTSLTINDALLDHNGNAIVWTDGPVGRLTTETLPIVTGTGIAGDVIKVYVNYYGSQSLAGSTLADASGHWSLALTKALSQDLGDVTRFHVTQTSPGLADSAQVIGGWFGVGSVPATPAAPVMTDDSGHAIAAGSTTSDAHPNISGTGTAGDIIKLYDGSTVIGSVKIGADGKWTIKPTTDLSNGTHDLYVTETNPAGTPSAASPHVAITVDTTPVVAGAPVITSVIDAVGPVTGNVPSGGTTDDPLPTIKGTGIPGDTVYVYVAQTGAPYGSGDTVVGADGTWSVQLNKYLAMGVNTITATQFAAGQAQSAASNSWSVTFDMSTPATPAAPVLSNDSGAAIPAGTTTIDAHPNISGTGTAGDIIKVYDGSTVIGSVKIGTDGKWTFKPTTDLSNGTHDLYVTETNAAGTPSAASPHIALTVDTNPVAGAPVITNVQDAVGPIQGTVPNNGTTDDSHPTISGTGVAGDTVYIYQNGAGCGNTTVDATGHWSLKLTGALSEGAHAMTATQFASGQGQSAASNTWTITVDTSTPAAPAITALYDFTALDSTAPNPIPQNGTAGSPTVWVYGTGVAGDVVHVMDNGKEIFTATVAANGTWGYRVDGLAAGAHDLTATQANPATGAVSAASGDWRFTVGTNPVASAPVITDVQDAVGLIQGTVPNNGTTDDNHPTISGTGIAGDTIYIYQNGAGCGNTTVDATGHWSVKIAGGLSEGAHTMTATQFGGGQGQSAASNTWTITVNTGTPKTPTAPVLTDDSGAAISAGSTTSDAHPNVSGTGTAGDIIKLYDGSTVIGSVKIGTDGKWTFKPTTDLSSGTHDLYVTETNPAGTPSAASPHVALVVTTAPTIVITAVYDQNHNLITNGGSVNGTFTVTGTVTGYSPGDLVYLNFGGPTMANTGYVRPQVLLDVVGGTFSVVVSSGLHANYVDNGVFHTSGAIFGSPGSITMVAGIAHGEAGSYASSSAYYVTETAANWGSTGVSATHTVAETLDTTQSDAAASITPDVTATSTHTVVGEHDAFVGHLANGNETVDLNADPGSYFKESTAHIQGAGGTAIDTLHLTGDHQVLDLTSLTGTTSAAKISGIEVIDLGGHSNNLKVSLLDVLNLGEADLFQQDGKQQMMVKGAAGDSVDLSNTHVAGVADGVWEQHGTTQVGGVTYNVYEHSGAHTELLVQQGVQIIVH